MKQDIVNFLWFYAPELRQHYSRCSDQARPIAGASIILCFSHHHHHHHRQHYIGDKRPMLHCHTTIRGRKYLAVVIEGWGSGPKHWVLVYQTDTKAPTPWSKQTIMQTLNIVGGKTSSARQFPCGFHMGKFSGFQRAWWCSDTHAFLASHCIGHKHQGYALLVSTS